MKMERFYNSKKWGPELEAVQKFIKVSITQFCLLSRLGNYSLNLFEIWKGSVKLVINLVMISSCVNLSKLTMISEFIRIQNEAKKQTIL